MTKKSNNSQHGSSTNSGADTLAGGGNLMYLIAGGLIGAAAALLLAPKAGSALRGDIADVTRKGYDGALDLTSKVKDQTSTLVQTIREKGTGLVGGASQKLSSGGEAAATGVAEAAGTAGDVLSLNEGDNDTGVGNSGMSASNGAA